MHDPAQLVSLGSPPVSGKGSSRNDWMAYASKVAVANFNLQAVIRQQSDVIRLLQAEVEILREQIARRRPPGGRQPLDPNKVTRIEQEIEAGGADRAIAKRYGVSHMTVHRIHKRMRDRERVAAH